MKTQEELNALKEEVEALNKKLHDLTEEELAQVSGGIFQPRRPAAIYAPTSLDAGAAPALPTRSLPSRLDFGMCIAIEGVALGPDRTSYTTYKCSDPDNKGKKRSCGECPAN